MIETIRTAHQNAEHSGRPFFAELEALTQSEPRLLLAQVAEHFRLPAIDMAAMQEKDPAFDILPLARAQEAWTLPMTNEIKTMIDVNA